MLRPVRSMLLAVCATATAALVAEAVLAGFGLGPAAPLRRASASDATPWPWGQLIHQASAVPGLAYELVPDLDVELNGVRVRTNDLGLRGPAPLPVRGPALVRLAVLGDSTTFGFGVAAEEAWPGRLGPLLDAARPGWVHEVLNLGVSGYSARDEALVLEARALPLEPDVVVVGYNLNDPEIEARQPLQAYFATAPWWERSRLLRWAEAQWRARRAGTGDPIRRLHRRGSPTWASVEAAFASMAQACAARDLPILLVVFPLGEVPADAAAYRYADVHAQVLDAGRAAGMETLDLVPAFAAAAGGDGYLLPDSHPNPTGHLIAARAVSARLVALTRAPDGTQPAGRPLLPATRR